VLGQILFSNSKKSEPNQSGVFCTSTSPLEVVLTLILGICLSAVVVYIVVGYDQIGGTVGSCKLQVLEKATSGMDHDETKLIAALNFCSLT
jgi:hypothetical protein